MRYLPIIFLVLFISCNHNDTKDLPECVEKFTKIESSIIVKTQEVNNENHYWINTTAVTNDSEVIVNEQCDTICFVPFGLAYFECLEAYTKTWDSIWPK